MKNVREHSKVKLVTAETGGKYLVSEPNYHTTKIFNKNLLAIEMRKNQILLNKLVYLGWSISDLGKTVMY